MILITAYNFKRWCCLIISWSTFFLKIGNHDDSIQEWVGEVVSILRRITDKNTDLASNVEIMTSTRTLLHKVNGNNLMAMMLVKLVDHIPTNCLLFEVGRKF